MLRNPDSDQQELSTAEEVLLELEMSNTLASLKKSQSLKHFKIVCTLLIKLKGIHDFLIYQVL